MIPAPCSAWVVVRAGQELTAPGPSAMVREDDAPIGGGGQGESAGGAQEMRKPFTYIL